MSGKEGHGQKEPKDKQTCQKREREAKDRNMSEKRDTHQKQREPKQRQCER